MGDKHEVAGEQPHLEDGQEEEHDHGQQQGELDGRLPALRLPPPGSAPLLHHATFDITASMTEFNSFDTLSVLEAHAMTSAATAAAPTRTSAYSAVDWPASPRIRRSEEHTSELQPPMRTSYAV